jgi:hypothetical protein
MPARNIDASRDMTDTVSFDEAQRCFVETFPPIANSTCVPLNAAWGRVMAVPLHATQVWGIRL